MQQYRWEGYVLDSSVFEIIIKEHSDVIQRMSLREHREKVVILGTAMDLVRHFLDETDKCHHKSPIERLMWMYLTQWISEQDDPQCYDIITQHALEDGGDGPRVIDIVLQYCGDDGIVHVAIECDGKDHLRPHVAKRDIEKDRYLWEKYGVETVRIPGIKIFNKRDYCVDKVARALERTRDRSRKEDRIH